MRVGFRLAMEDCASDAQVGEQRRRDPLFDLPFAPAPLAVGSAVHSGSSRESLRTLRRTNRSVAAVRALARGSVRDLHLEKGQARGRGQWEAARPRQRRLVEGMWSRHLARADWDPEVHGREALARMVSSKGGGYMLSSPVNMRSAARGQPVRGAMWPIVPEDVALPPPGSKPKRLEDLSPSCKRFLEASANRMLLHDSEVDWDTYHAIKPYMDPALRSKKTALRLVLRLALAGMLRWTRAAEHVSVFGVVKGVDEASGKVATRLVWDLRRVNQRFRVPPATPMASPAALAAVDLSESVAGGLELTTCVGDIPNFFYLLQIPEELSCWFAFEGITACQLWDFARAQGVTLPAEMGPPAQGLDVGLAVVAMGWSWSVFFAHTTLTEVLESDPQHLQPGGRLEHARPVPQFDRWTLLHWLYVDDYGAARLEVPSGASLDELPIAEDGREIKRRLEAFGLSAHKEAVARGLDKSLGVSIRGDVVQVVESKVKDAVTATEFLLSRFRVSGREVDAVLGLWTWIAMVARGLLSIPNAVYAWLAEHRRKTSAALPDALRDEFQGLLGLSIFAQADLRAEWHEWAFMVDASWYGFGIVSTKSTVLELRTAAMGAEAKGWHAAAVDIPDDTDSDVSEHGYLQERAEHLALRQAKESGPGFLELFAGSAHLAMAVKALHLSWTEDWEVERGPQFDLLDTDNLARLFADIRGGAYWFVHLGPPCSSFSRARLPRVRTLQHINGLPNLSVEAQKFVDDGTHMMLVAVEICHWCHQCGVHFSLENPDSSLMFLHPAMLKLKAEVKAFDVQLDYCAFGEAWRKPTRLLTTCEELHVLGRRCTPRAGRCSTSGRPHISLRGTVPVGHETFSAWAGQLWTKVATAYPMGFCEQFAKALASMSPAGAGRPGGLVGAARPCARLSAPPPELPKRWQTPARWHLVLAARWAKEEHQNVLECRAAVAVLRRLSRSSKAWGRRVLIATDSLVTLGVLVKGRSSSAPLLAVAREAAAVQLVCGIRPYWRWVASEHNWADGPSRGEGVGLAGETEAKAGKPKLPRRLRVLLERRRAGLSSARLRHW